MLDNDFIDVRRSHTTTEDQHHTTVLNSSIDCDVHPCLSSMPLNDPDLSTGCEGFPEGTIHGARQPQVFNMKLQGRVVP